MSKPFANVYIQYNMFKPIIFYNNEFIGSIFINFLPPPRYLANQVSSSFWIFSHQRWYFHVFTVKTRQCLELSEMHFMKCNKVCWKKCCICWHSVLSDSLYLLIWWDFSKVIQVKWTLLITKMRWNRSVAIKLQISLMFIVNVQLILYRFTIWIDQFWKTMN